MDGSLLLHVPCVYCFWYVQLCTCKYKALFEAICLGECGLIVDFVVQINEVRWLHYALPTGQSNNWSTMYYTCMYIPEHTIWCAPARTCSFVLGFVFVRVQLVYLRE